jgi:hypothetical protein
MDTTYATLASLLPYDLIESKPGLNPNEYTIKAAPPQGLSLTIIPNNVFYLVNPDPLSEAKEIRHIKVPVSAVEVAQAIINDYVNALLGAVPPDAVPGLFVVQGDWQDKKEFISKHISEMTTYRTAQNAWFKNLVDIADDVWQKSKSPLGISDLERSACRELGFARDWLNPLPNEQIEKCPVCKNAINLGALKCAVCGHILDKKAYDMVMAGVK